MMQQSTFIYMFLHICSVAFVYSSQIINVYSNVIHANFTTVSVAVPDTKSSKAPSKGPTIVLTLTPTTSITSGPISSTSPSFSPQLSLLPTPSRSPTTVPTYTRTSFTATLNSNRNSTSAANVVTSKDKNLSTTSMLYTLAISVIMFVFFLSFFEYSRRFKQIYLKRYQKRFILLEQVPPQPPDSTFGWFRAIWGVTEIDVLSMVGLDAYMLLRYHAICIKLGVFISLWALLILLPVYGSAGGPLTEWDKYTILNIASNLPASADRFWVPVLFSYLFAAYFCQLFYAEYDRFSTLRLSYLAKADEVNPGRVDPDVMPQKDYTIMIEHIPAHLRSERKLFDFFDDLFPGDVFTVEISLDLRELNSIVWRRQQMRNQLERAIAYYVATRRRRIISGFTRGFDPFDILDLEGGDKNKVFYRESHAAVVELTQQGVDKRNSLLAKFKYFIRLLKREVCGLEDVDAINYYTSMLLRLNSETKELQAKFNDIATRVDVEMQKRIKNKHDTRVAAALETIGVQGIGQNILDIVEGKTAPVEKIRHFSKRAIAHLKNVRKSRVTKEGGVDGFAISELADSDVEDSDSVAASDYSLPPTPIIDGMRNALRNSYTSVAPTSGCAESEYQITSICEEEDEEKHEDSEQVAQRITPHSLNENNPIVSSSESEIIYDPPPPSLLAGASDSTPEIERLISPVKKWSQSAEPKESRDALYQSLHPSEQHLYLDDAGDGAIGGDEAAPIETVTPGSRFSFAKELLSKLRFGSRAASPVGADLDSQQPISPGRSQEIIKNAKIGSKEAWNQTKIAGTGALRGVIEAERVFEMILFGAYYKYSSTAFITFRTRKAETIANQLLLDHDVMQINHAPHPNDIIWDNVAIPKSQISYRNFITNVGLIIGSIFWSSLVTATNNFAQSFELPENEQNLVSVFILLGFLLMLPFIFDVLARYYEGMKLESEIQNAIMTRYFYYQLVNIYVTVALDGINVHDMVINALRTPMTFVTLLGETVPAVSLYFCSLVIVKIFAAVPIEMLRPWQLSTILSMAYVLDQKKCTRRELRTGAFFAWPMLYGWVYPQLVIVQTIMVVYACISPLLIPFCVLFFIFTYIMYKYQLLYVYVNDNQSGGFMWYATFNRSLLGLLFASLALIAFFSLSYINQDAQGPFYAMLPLPLGIVYFWHYCDSMFKKKKDLSFLMAKRRDNRNKVRKDAGLAIPLDNFKEHFYRQPILAVSECYPEAYRKYDDAEPAHTQPNVTSSGEVVNNPLHTPNDQAASCDTSAPTTPKQQRPRRGESLSSDPASPSRIALRMKASAIDVHRVVDEVEDDQAALETYFREYVLPLTQLQ